MPRPHLEFIQAQMLSWHPLAAQSSRPGVERKLLSEDPHSGATSNLFRYPAGWTAPANQRLTCDEELYVLDGALTINGLDYGPGDYAYLPSGFLRQSANSSAGAAVVTFLEGRLRLGNDETSLGDGLIERVQSRGLPWASAGDSRVAGSHVGLKVLRLDASSGDRTWLLNIEVSDGKAFEINGVERHPCVEETFLLSGDMAMPMGHMRDGAYFWRPPHIPHGPMGTQTGFLGLFRCKEGGHFDTQWSEAAGPIDWQAPYSPIVPDQLGYNLSSDYDHAQPY